MVSIVESSAGSFEYDQVLGVKETMVSYIYYLLHFIFQFLHSVVLFYLLHKKDCIHLCYSPPGYTPIQIVDRNFISVTSTYVLHGHWSLVSHFFSLILISVCISIYMLWFNNFIPGLNFISFCFKLIISHCHIPKQREITFKPRIKLHHNIYILFCNKLKLDL